jgi:hypothetical protein
MAVVLYIKWSMEGEITDHHVLEVSDTEKQKLLDRNVGNPNPKYCEVSQAFRYGLQVDQIKVDQDESKVKKVAIKSESVEEDSTEKTQESEKIEEKKPKVILAKSEIK